MSFGNTINIKLPKYVIILLLSLCSFVYSQNITYVNSIDSNLYAPSSLELFDGGLAVLETYTNEIKEFGPNGIISQKVHFQNKASGLTRIDNHQYLISELQLKKIIQIDLLTGVQTNFLNEEDGLKEPIDLLYSGGTIYVLDLGQQAIMKFNKIGFSLSIIKLDNPSLGAINNFSSFDYNPRLQQFYLLDQTKSTVYIIDAAGNYIGSFGAFGVNEGEFTRGGEVKVTPSNHVLVTDRFQGQVSIFDYDGKYLDRISGLEIGSNTMYMPIGIDVDENGIVYISSLMRPGIDIYHVNFSAMGSNIVLSGQYYPDDMAELKSAEVQLIAYAQSNDSLDFVTGFSFELYDSPDLNNLIESSEIIKPENNNNSTLNYELVTGTWEPKYDFSEKQTYYWRSRLETTDSSSTWSAARSFTVIAIPGSFQLRQNYPNPFNPMTTISFTLPREMEITLEIFNILGQKIRILENDIFEAGTQNVVWDGKDDSGHDVVSGVYFYRIIANEYSDQKKMVLIK